MEENTLQKNSSSIAMKKALIIDDEPIINRLNKKILSGLDIQSDCKNNLDCLKGENINHLSSYDIIIIDLNLIRRNEGKILDELKNFKEQLPILITSGYLKESANDYLVRYDNIGYIQKPYRMEDFICEVKSLLEA